MKKYFFIPIFLIFSLSFIVACSSKENKDRGKAIEYIDSFKDDLISNISVSILYKNPSIKDVKYAFESVEENNWATVYYMFPQDGYYLTNTLSGDYSSKGKIYYIDGSYELIDESTTTFEKFKSSYYYSNFNLENLDFTKSKFSQKDQLSDKVLYIFDFNRTVNLNINYPEYNLNLKDIEISFELTQKQVKLDLISLKAFDSITNQYIELIISSII